MQQVMTARLAVAIGVILAMIAATIAMAIAPSPAHATAYKGNCAGTATAPSGVTLNSYGYKTSKANGKVYCSNPGRYVQVHIQLWGEDDADGDDLIASAKTPSTSKTWVGAYSTKYFNTGWARCNEDKIGNDELYSRMQFRVYSNGIWSSWSAWDRSGYISVSC